jgi:hypothetical protein
LAGQRGESVRVKVVDPVVLDDGDVDDRNARLGVFDLRIAVDASPEDHLLPHPSGFPLGRGRANSHQLALEGSPMADVRPSDL